MICVREYFYLQRIMLLDENNKSTSCFLLSSNKKNVQRYALLGNSLNVDVAAVLIKLMVLGDDETKLTPEELAELNRLKAEFQ